MAFNKSASAAASIAVPGAYEKAISFVNVYLPRKDGSKMKVGAFSFVASKEEQKQLHDYLASNDENLEKFTSKLVFEFRPVNAKASSALDLD